MDVMTVFGAIAGALFFYSMGAIAGFGYACSRDGRRWADVARDYLDSMDAPSEPNKKPDLYLIRRSMR